MSGFLSPAALLAGGSSGLTHATERALWHLGFTDVRVIDGAGDQGADLLAVRDREQWVVQCKYSSRGAVDRTGVDDAERARSRYGADHAVVAPPARSEGPVRVAVSRSRAPQLVLALATALGAETVPLGSAGAKTAAVVLGEVDAYVHSGGQHEWDSAAPVAVARAAGLHASRLDGRPLAYNRPDPFLPDLVVCRPELAADVLAGLARLRTEAPP